MEHVVFFPAPDGTPAFRRFAGLEDAARFVEHLRNVENVSEASVHALTEVPLSFKTWYRVEVPTGPEASSPAQPVIDLPAAALVEAPAVELPVQLPPVDVPAAPATIAEAIESFNHSPAPSAPVAPEVGSATGIVVPEEPFVAIDQPFVAVDHFAAPAVPPVPAPAPAQPAAEERATQAQVFEAAFGAPRTRERGTGYFAR